jgi:hypothetical protein
MTTRGKYLRTEEHRQLKREASTKHGLSKTPTWWSWSGMRARCMDPGHRDWSRYGGRGIVICDRWRDFAAFYADMGPRPEGKTLDRIDSTGNYEPGNCRWATPLEQRLNQQRTTRMADCHPDRKHCAFGLCRPCYKKRRRDVGLAD